jgi:prepilin signal peptidase PulO-like enzyme (type II secretory pathway)
MNPHWLPLGLDVAAGCLMLLLAVSDARRLRLPLRWMGLLYLSVFLKGWLLGGWVGLLAALVGVLVVWLPFGLMRLILGKRADQWLGGGDWLLAGALGAWLGPSMALAVLALSFAFSAILGFALHRRRVPFASVCAVVVAAGWASGALT